MGGGGEKRKGAQGDRAVNTGAHHPPLPPVAFLELSRDRLMSPPPGARTPPPSHQDMNQKTSILGSHPPPPPPPVRLNLLLKHFLSFCSPYSFTHLCMHAALPVWGLSDFLFSVIRPPLMLARLLLNSSFPPAQLLYLSSSTHRCMLVYPS